MRTCHVPTHLNNHTHTRIDSKPAHRIPTTTDDTAAIEPPPRVDLDAVYRSAPDR